ncbi:Integrase family protein [Desulfonema limicola]|uniref:Integrase family protein n=1 Tax=Desulfonema limicola TaxID=45656 RepID=A0A975B4J5_9BACT|nr:site-specific integrase [Desulfonema limicola]QTA78665.1 Integrase family protein [Desulfonema limicola]
MAILIFCNTCNLFYSRKNKLCPKCGLNLSGSKKFRVNVSTPNGSRITKTVDGNLTIAKRVEAKIKTDISQQKHLGIKTASVLSDVWEQYLKWAKINKKSWKADYSRWNQHITDYIGNKKMDSITASDIQKILYKMYASGGRDGSGCSAATIKHVLLVVKRIFNWAKEQELYDGPNPADKIKPPKLNNQITECLTEEELDRLLNVLDNWQNRIAAFIVKFALFTGLRSDECMGLKWEDVDFRMNFISLIDPKGNPVTLPMNQMAMEVLKNAKEIMPFPECIYVFPNREGQRRTSFTNIWYRIRKKADIKKDFRFHGLRHTFASYLASSGKVDLYTLQKLLNHQSPQMTQRYAHLLDHALRRGANVADEVFGNIQ